MLKHTLFFLLLMHIQSVIAQQRITDSLTYVTDSSYNLTTAYEKAKKYNASAQYPILTFSNVGSTLLRHKMTKNDLEYVVNFPKTSNQTAIIFLFGGGWRSGSIYMLDGLSVALTEKGYTVILPKYPLSTHEQYPSALLKINLLIEEIRSKAKEWKINDQQIVIAGFSAGATLASLIASTNGSSLYKDFVSHPNKSLVNALINIDGTLSFVHPDSGEGDDSKKLSAATMWLGYKKLDHYKLWEEASPLTHVNKKSPPTLFINSGIQRMHAGREEYKKQLDSLNIYYEQKSFDINLHHFIFFEPWFTPSIHSIDQFLRKVFSIQD